MVAYKLISLFLNAFASKIKRLRNFSRTIVDPCLSFFAKKDRFCSFLFHLVSLRQLSSRDTVRYAKDRRVKAIPLLDNFTEWKVSVKSDKPFHSVIRISRKNFPKLMHDLSSSFYGILNEKGRIT